MKKADIRRPGRPSVPMQRVDVMVRIVRTMKKQIDNSSLMFIIIN